MTRGTLAALTTVALVLSACSSSSTTPTPSGTPAPTPPGTSALTAAFDENPVPFRDTGCSFSTPQGWFTQVRIQETAGVAFTPATLTQKLDGSPVGSLNESFSSRFGACSGMAFTPGMVLAKGAVCGVVGVCTSSTYSNYQFSIAGTDANSHTLTFDSPLLQFGARPAAQASPARSSREADGTARLFPPSSGLDERQRTMRLSWR